nr:hypothetical protein [Tanacetum cinerariifolium]
MIYYVLQKQCFSDDDNFDFPLIYDVNGHSLHFRRRQFCLLTGFKFGSISFCEYRNGDIPFHNRLFPEKIGRDLGSVVDDVYLRMVNDLDAWNLFPWDMDNRVFLCIGSLVDQSARNHTESIVIEEKVSLSGRWAVVGRCKFPWCNDITIDHSFWNSLSALDDNRKGWLLDE